MPVSVLDMSSKNLYEILGCSPTSSPEILKQAYHRKLLESHPDKSANGIPKTSTAFHEVSSAWKILGNPGSRRDYDNRLRQEELETIGAVIYARLTPRDLVKTDDEDYLSYPCRCGNSYLVDKTDLEERNVVIHVPCQDCTFVIAVET